MERWKPVVGFEGLYEVSDQGRVRSLRTGRILKPQKQTTGYLQVSLGRRLHTVHKIVLHAFCGPRPVGCVAAHGDGNKGNNRLANLRYATPIENAADMIAHGTRMVGEKNPRRKLSAAEVLWIRENSHMKQQALAVKFAVRQTAISKILRRQRWTAI